MADLSLNPDFVFEETISYKTLVTEFENGVEQRRQKWAAGLRKFRCVYKNRSSSDWGTIKSLFVEKLGRLTTFSFTNPNDSTSYAVRFDSDEIVPKYKAFGVYDFEFDLIQVK